MNKLGFWTSVQMSSKLTDETRTKRTGSLEFWTETGFSIEIKIDEDFQSEIVVAKVIRLGQYLDTCVVLLVKTVFLHAYIHKIIIFRKNKTGRQDLTKVAFTYPKKTTKYVFET